LSDTEKMSGQGFGTWLLAFAERFRGPEGLSVIVGDHEVASLPFFEGAGFAEAARRRMVKDGWQTPGTEWILLRKA
jgi:GNAT superfamily N-acetyltransferase